MNMGTPPPLPTNQDTLQNSAQHSVALQNNDNAITNTVHYFHFHGDGLSYFKIWIVNILLTIVTLGLYSPWAKVRKLRYFYGNTELDHHRFDFIADPKRILIGRLIAVAIYALFWFSDYISWWAGGVATLLLIVLLPWLYRASMRFVARNSQYCNIAFRFDSKLGETYGVFFLMSIVSIISFGLLYPVALWLFKRYQFENMSFAGRKFQFNTRILDFYKAALLPALFLFVINFAVFNFSDGINIIIGDDGEFVWYQMVPIVLAYLSFMFVYPLMQAMIHQAIWGKLTLGNNRFELSNFSSLRFAWILLSNYLAILLSLGLLSAWAAVRIHRYKIETLSLVAVDDLNHLIAENSSDQSAIAQEITDVFDFDLSW